MVWVVSVVVADGVLDSEPGVVELLVVVVAVVVVTEGAAMEVLPPAKQAASANVPCQFRIWPGTGVVVPLVCVVVVVVEVLVV